MQAHSSINSSYVAYASKKSACINAYKLAISKIKSSLNKIKTKWRHLNGDDPEVSNFGLIALILIGMWLVASFYVSFLDGWFREFWLMVAASAGM